MSNGLSRNRAALRGGLLALATGLALAGLAAAAQAEPVKLVFATGIPPQSPIVKDVMEPWAAEANAASEGEYEIEVVNGFALANNTNMIDRVKAGVVDIGFALHGASGLPFDKTMVVSLPLIVTDHAALVDRLGLDGVHLSDPRSLRKLRTDWGPDPIIGAYCGTSRHDGMLAGEAGADYVAFGPAGIASLGTGERAEVELFADDRTSRRGRGRARPCHDRGAGTGNRFHRPGRGDLVHR